MNLRPPSSAGPIHVDLSSYMAPYWNLHNWSRTVDISLRLYNYASIWATIIAIMASLRCVVREGLLSDHCCSKRDLLHGSINNVDALLMLWQMNYFIDEDVCNWKTACFFCLHVQLVYKTMVILSSVQDLSRVVYQYSVFKFKQNISVDYKKSYFKIVYHVLILIATWPKIALL